MHLGGQGQRDSLGLVGRFRDEELRDVQRVT